MESGRQSDAWGGVRVADTPPLLCARDPRRPRQAARRRTADVRRGREAVRRDQRRALPRPGPALAPRRDRGGRPAARRHGARPRRRHRHLQPAVRRPRRARWCRATSRSACSGWASRPGRRCRSPPATARGCPSPTTPSTPSRSPSGCATSSTRWPACARCSASPGPAAGWSSASSATRPGRRSAPSTSSTSCAPCPPIARAVSSSPDAYVYLAESIRAWPDQRGLADLIAEAGWRRPEWRNLSGGIVALHRATA